MKTEAVLLVAILGVWGLSISAQAGTLPGSGTEEDPYLIEDLSDFDTFADPCNSSTYWARGVYTKLMCDPNLFGRTYSTAVIAPETVTGGGFGGTVFGGIFDGNGHIINNLTIDSNGIGNEYLGLFGKIEGSSAEVENLGLVDVNITAGDNSDYLGGLCGYSSSSTITNCYTTGSVACGNSSNYLGGLCGRNNAGTISNCYATGSVTGGVSSGYLGGLCGYNSYGVISNSYSIGLVTGGDNSYHLGGLCGRKSSFGSITNSYYYLFSGPDNGLGIDLDELQVQDASSFAGFDFAGNPDDGTEDYWTIVSGYCPKLAWQSDNGPVRPTVPATTLWGSGNQSNPFQINSHADFTEFRTNAGLNCGYYILNTDIDLSGETFTTAVINKNFGGHFNGNSHVIRNITIDTVGVDTKDLGLFSRIFASSSNIGIEDITITAGDNSDYLGGLCGYSSGTITNCYTTGSVSCGNSSYHLGGLCGQNHFGTIQNSYSTVSVAGEDHCESFGGLCGENYFGTIMNCNAQGSVSGEDYCESFGGLCGENYYGTIMNCSAQGSVAGKYNSMGLGGFCGYNDINGDINLCFATGDVTGTRNEIGAMCGENFYGTISNSYATGSTDNDSRSVSSFCNANYGAIRKCYAARVTICNRNWRTITDCYWDTDLSGIDLGSGGRPVSTPDMMKASTFKGWNEGNWSINENSSYPHLTWEMKPGTIISTGYPAAAYPGNGTSIPFELSSPAHLVSMSQRTCDWDKDFLLTADIDMSSTTGFLPVADFTGRLDGQGHVISNLTINANVTKNQQQVALLGYIGESAYVSNLGIENVTLTGEELVGGVCGMNRGGTLENCYVTGSVTDAMEASIAGGLCGYNFHVIINCYANVEIVGEDHLGGLCGWSPGDISSSFATGDVSGRYDIGGFCGVNSGEVMNCYAKGNVTQTSTWSDYTGGLCGINWDTIRNCYATGSVNGTEGDRGGICGVNFTSSAIIENCFWNIETQVGTPPESVGANPNGGTITNVFGKTTVEMQTQNTYTDYGWDFIGETTNGTDDIWTSCEGQDYPRLSWEKYGGGSGTAEDPYLIYTSCQMQAIGANSDDWDKHFKMMADIDMSSYTYSRAVIAYDTNELLYGFQGTSFSGVFDGAGHVISNFACNSSQSYVVGLFGYVYGEGSEIRNLKLVAPQIDAEDTSWVGSLVGKLEDGTVTNCHSDMLSIMSISGSAGGLVGRNDEGLVEHCSSSGTVTGRSIGGLIGVGFYAQTKDSVSSCIVSNISNYLHRSGGLMGSATGGEVRRCSASGLVSGDDGWKGGLIGKCSNAYVSKCFATGNVVTNASYVVIGGLVGSNLNGIIEECYATGNVLGPLVPGESGGLVGRNHSYDNEPVSVIRRCYATGNVQGGYDAGGLAGTNRNNSIIDKCYSTGTPLDAIYRAYGLVGLSDYGGQVYDSFWDVETSETYLSAGGIGLPTAQMQMESTFTAVGWDFVGETTNGIQDIWLIDEGHDYPRLAWPIAIVCDFAIDHTWMYQSLVGQTNSDLMADVLITDDPLNNSSYTYDWEIILPDDVTVAPTITGGGGPADPCCRFAAPSCNEPGGISDSGQTFTVRVTITGADFGNTGIAEAEFGIALLGDANNDGVVNVADRAIINAFWRLGVAGPFTFTDCDINCDEVINIADRAIANGVWRGVLGQNRVSSPCPLR